MCYKVRIFRVNRLRNIPYQRFEEVFWESCGASGGGNDSRFYCVYCRIGSFVDAISPKGMIYLGSGYAFSQTIKNIYLNLLMGTTVAFLGMFLGSICSYLLACYIWNDWVRNKILNHKHLKVIEKALRSKSLKLLFYIRLSPIMPQVGTNYMVGAI